MERVCRYTESKYSRYILYICTQLRVRRLLFQCTQYRAAILQFVQQSPYIHRPYTRRSTQDNVILRAAAYITGTCTRTQCMQRMMRVQCMQSRSATHQAASNVYLVYLTLVLIPWLNLTHHSNPGFSVCASPDLENF